MSSPQNSTQQFGQSKAKHCRLCRQHGVAVAYLAHRICPFEQCKCHKCNLIKLQRKIMAEQIRLRRKDDGTSARTLVPYSNYNCQRCKNHGEEVSKKKHNDCPYTECACQLCVLAKARSYVELEIKQSCTMNRKSRKPRGKSNEMDNEMIGLMYNIFAKNSQPIVVQPNLTPSTQFNGPTQFQTNLPVPNLTVSSSTFTDPSQFIPNFLVKTEASSPNSYPTLDKAFNFIPSPQSFNFIPSPQAFIQPNNQQFLHSLSPATIGQQSNLLSLNFFGSQYLSSINVPKPTQ